MKKKKTVKSVNILGLNISGTNWDGVLKRVFLKRKKMLHVMTINPEFVMEARVNQRFKMVLGQAELKVADGWGVVWAVGLLKGIKIERISGLSLVEKILKRADEKKEKVFLLGAMPGVAAKAAMMIKKVYPNLKIDHFEGSKNVRRERKEEMGMTLAKINSFEPDYLLVAYGSPWQDIWIEENRPYLRVRVAMGVGGVLDEWAGVVKRCPKWLDKIGLKWLWRLGWQPWRWRRVGKVFGFAGLVGWEWLRLRIGGGKIKIADGV